ncbi:predicted protein [Histoplasma capsulatum G186AR]|uniref:Uncharacterized protein n=1 Tax=Ajellomyces capsulatus (strain G186AR / H82 / ATCC MYA-2454 / RMSCC 2432) TaxID=447093 RepID=C0NGX9_AJECG|nr:uncharacterized protein HCBG_02601 [Histoplasma capsulatum G186AR]EEH09064.1 predicted protein [Histoplasma capsulatum G186AR]
MTDYGSNRASGSIRAQVILEELVNVPSSKITVIILAYAPFVDHRKGNRAKPKWLALDRMPNGVRPDGFDILYLGTEAPRVAGILWTRPDSGLEFSQDSPLCRLWFLVNGTLRLDMVLTKIPRGECG